MTANTPHVSVFARRSEVSAAMSRTPSSTSSASWPQQRVAEPLAHLADRRERLAFDAVHPTRMR